jgi:hypothetical protein
MRSTWCRNPRVSFRCRADSIATGQIPAQHPLRRPTISCVVDKPAGFGPSILQPGNRERHTVNALLHHCNQPERELWWEVERRSRHTSHRLGKDTSGLFGWRPKSDVAHRSSWFGSLPDGRVTKIDLAMAAAEDFSVVQAKKVKK